MSITITHPCLSPRLPPERRIVTINFEGARATARPIYLSANMAETLALKLLEIVRLSDAKEPDQQPRRALVCPRCGGRSVGQDTSISWDCHEQAWVTGEPYDRSGSCGDCGASDFRPEWVDLDAADEIEDDPDRQTV